MSVASHPGPLEVRLHGRGGQGVVTAAELLSVAAFLDGRHAQAFPSFGSERTGAPVVSFCRIGDAPIRLREPIVSPDAVIIVDPTLLHHVDVFGGLRGAGTVLINTERELPELQLAEFAAGRSGSVRTVPATAIARRCLGRPLPNAALLGAFSALSAAVSLSSVLAAIHERFAGAVGDANASAAEEAYRTVLLPTRMLEAGRA